MIVVAIVVAYIGNRTANYPLEKLAVGLLVILMTVTVFYGVLKLKRLQGVFEANAPAKVPKEGKDAKV